MRLGWKLCQGILRVTPKVSLVDENITIRAKGLRPLQKVKLGLKVSNHHDIEYNSSLPFLANSKGELTLTNETALSLFWHLRPNNGVPRRFWTTDVTKHFQCQFDCQVDEEEEIVATETITRKIMGSGVKRIPLDDGKIKATLFLPKGLGPFPAIVSMHGGLVKGQIVEERAALLASRGFASLALGFFGLPGLPPDYSDLDLDYFEAAIDLLSGRKEVTTKKGLGAIGISKSSEIALLLGTHCSDKVTAVVAMNGLPMMTGKYTFKGKPLHKDWQFSRENLHGILPNGDIDFSPLFHNAAEKKDSFIHKKGNATKTLFIFGLDDRCSPPQAPIQIIHQLVDQTNYEIMTLPGTGHLIELPNSPPVTKSNHVLFPRNQVVMGGSNIDLHSKGQILAWQKLLAFFHNNLS